MGLLDYWHGWWGRRTSVIGDVVEGAVDGAIVDEILDSKHDRRRTIKLLEDISSKISNQSTPPAVKETLSIWRSQLDSIELHNRFMSRFIDPKFRGININLVCRWDILCGKSIKLGIYPLKSMPRSISGDIVGTASVLSKAMDKLESQIKTFEEYNEIERQINSVK